jgi:hypothetical protein
MGRKARGIFQWMSFFGKNSNGKLSFEVFKFPCWLFNLSDIEVVSLLFYDTPNGKILLRNYQKVLIVE